MTNVVYQPSQTTHWKNLFESKTMLLGSHNLNEGEELVAQIKCVSIQKIRNQQGKDEHVPVCEFFNAPPMVLNITNTRVIASLYGDNYDQWANQYIQIFATMVRAFGANQMALRIRQKKPQVGVDVSQYEASIRSCKTIQELQKAFMDIPRELKPQLTAVKDEMKEVLTNA